MSSFVIEFVFCHAGARELTNLIVPRVYGLSPVGSNLPGVEGLKNKYDGSHLKVILMIFHLVEILAHFEPANSPTLRAVVSEDNIKS